MGLDYGHLEVLSSADDRNRANLGSLVTVSCLSLFAPQLGLTLTRKLDDTRKHMEVGSVSCSFTARFGAYIHSVTENDPPPLSELVMH